MRVYNALPTRALRIDAGSGTVDADLQLDPLGDIAHGRVHLRSSGSSMHLLGLAVQGGLDVDARVRRAELDSRSFVLDGTRVKLDGITREGGRPGWWLDARLQQASLSQAGPGGPSALDAQAAVGMRDASLLLELFAQRQHYPRWIDPVIDSGRGRGHARIRMDAGGLRLDPVQARNDRIEVSARLRARDEDLRGQLLARWGVMSAGVELRNGKSHFHLVRPRHWYESQPAP